MGKDQSQGQTQVGHVLAVKRADQKIRTEKRHELSFVRVLTEPGLKMGEQLRGETVGKRTIIGGAFFRKVHLDLPTAPFQAVGPGTTLASVSDHVKAAA